MATTLLQLKTRAREKADQVGSTFISDTELTTLINLGLTELYDLVENAFEDYFTISTPITVSSGTTFALPVDFYKLRGLDFNNSGSYEEVREFMFNERNNNQPRNLYWSRNYTFDRKYRIVGDNVILQPDAQAVGTYRLWYTPAVTPLVNPADTIPLSLSKFGWDEYIVLYATERMEVKEESSVADLVRQRGEIAGRITQMAANRQTDRSETIQDVRNFWDEY